MTPVQRATELKIKIKGLVRKELGTSDPTPQEFNEAFLKVLCAVLVGIADRITDRVAAIEVHQAIHLENGP